MADIANPDLRAVRRYVTARDAVAHAAVPAHVLLVDLTHSNLRQRHVEIRVPRHAPVDELRRLIHQKTGTPPGQQQLQIRNADGMVVAALDPDDDDDRGTYPVGYFLDRHGGTVHCVDLDPHSLSACGGLEDVSLVAKFRLSDAAYDARPTGTLRAWRRAQEAVDPTFTYARHAARHAEKLRSRGAAAAAVPADNADPAVGYGPATVAHVCVGDRCQLPVGKRRGEVMYVGVVPELAPGHWVGIGLDEPTGRNDGSVTVVAGVHNTTKSTTTATSASTATTTTSVRYFTVPPRYGAFVRGTHVQAGDFPVRDIFDDDSDDDEL